MSKDYKGYELIKAIRDGEIKENSVIEVHSLSVGDNVIAEIKYINRRLIWDAGEFNTGFLCDDSYYFRIVEEQEEIDIQDIEELENWLEYREFDIQVLNLCFKNHQEKINELVQAVKQLDRQLHKTEKEK